MKTPSRVPRYRCMVYSLLPRRSLQIACSRSYSTATVFRASSCTKTRTVCELTKAHSHPEKANAKAKRSIGRDQSKIYKHQRKFSFSLSVLLDVNGPLLPACGVSGTVIFSVMSVCLSVHRGSPCDHYPCCHCTAKVPPPVPYHMDKWDPSPCHLIGEEYQMHKCETIHVVGRDFLCDRSPCDRGVHYMVTPGG